MPEKTPARKPTQIIKPATAIRPGGGSIRNLDVVAGQLLIVSGLVLSIVGGGFGLVLVLLGVVEYFHGEGVEIRKKKQLLASPKSRPPRGPKPATMVFIYGVILIVASIALGALEIQSGESDPVSGFSRHDEQITISMMFVVGIGVTTAWWGLMDFRAGRYGVPRELLPIANPGALNFCPNCGHQLDPGAVSCLQCGHKLG